MISPLSQHSLGDWTKIGLLRLTQMVFNEQWSSVWDYANTDDTEVYTTDQLSKSSLVVACINWVITNALSAPLVLEQIVDDEWDPLPRDHDFLRLLAEPNPMTPVSHFWAAIITNWYVAGEVYVVKIRNNIGQVKQLWPVPSSVMTPVGNTDTLFSHFEYATSDGVKDIPVEDVIYMRTYNPKNLRRGLSYLHSLVDEIVIDDRANSFVSAMLKNYGISSLIVGPKEGQTWVANDKANAMERRLKSKLTGPQRGQPIVIQAPADIKQLSYDSGNTDLRFSRDTSEERIVSVFGLEISVVGFGSGLRATAVGATRMEARKQSWEDGIIPVQRILAENLYLQLLPDFVPDIRNYRVRFDTSDIPELQEDALKQAQRLTLLYKSNGISRGELRAPQGFEIEDVDDVLMQPGNIILVPRDHITEEPQDVSETEDDSGGGGTAPSNPPEREDEDEN